MEDITARDSAPRVLIVDDNEDLAIGLSKGLLVEGFEVTWTTDPNESVELVRENDFDVGILDLVMPRIWGIDLSQLLLREDPRLRCIILTAHGTIEHCRKAFKAGVADFITKPISLVDLSERIHSVLKPKGDFFPLLNFLRQHGIVPPGANVDENIADLLLDPLSLQLKDFKQKTVYHYLKRASEMCNGEPKRIATLTGCSLATVYRLLEQLGVSHNTRRAPNN